MDVDVDGHRKFGIIAPLNFAIISSGRTDGGRGGYLEDIHIPLFISALFSVVE